MSSSRSDLSRGGCVVLRALEAEEGLPGTLFRWSSRRRERQHCDDGPAAGRAAAAASSTPTMRHRQQQQARRRDVDDDGASVAFDETGRRTNTTREQRQRLRFLLGPRRASRPPRPTTRRRLVPHRQRLSGEVSPASSRTRRRWFPPTAAAASAGHRRGGRHGDGRLKASRRIGHGNGGRPPRRRVAPTPRRIGTRAAMPSRSATCRALRRPWSVSSPSVRVAEAPTEHRRLHAAQKTRAWHHPHFVVHGDEDTRQPHLQARTLRRRLARKVAAAVAGLAASRNGDARNHNGGGFQTRDDPWHGFEEATAASGANCSVRKKYHPPCARRRALSVEVRSRRRRRRRARP